MAINPYLKKQKDLQTAYINPKTGNLSIVGGGGGDATSFQKSQADEFTSKGYTTITDPNVIKQLQEGVSKTSSFNSPEQWQNYFKQTGLSVTGPTTEEIQAANQRLKQYQQYKDYAKPVTSQPTDQTQRLTNALTNNAQSGTQPQQFQGSTSDLINQQSQATTNALVSEIRNRINQAKQAQQDIIRQAPQQFDPLRSQSEVAKSQQLRSALERSSLMGDRGGIGRSEALATQTAGEQRLNEINLAQQNVVNNANAEIARLESQGQFEEARIIESQKAQALQNLLAERQRQEEIARQDALMAQQQAREDALLSQQQLQQSQDLERERFIQTLGRFSQNYQSEINNVANDNDPTNDWKIPILEAARQEKIASQNLDPVTGRPLPIDTTPTLTSSSALDLWAQTGVANEAISRALGIPVGTQYVRRTTGTSGGSGLSASSIATNARYKISQGLPLTAEEARIMGVQEGYVNQQPIQALETRTITNAIDNEIDRKMQTARDQIIESGMQVTTSPLTVQEQKNAALETIVSNPDWFGNDANKLRETLANYGISEQELVDYEDWRERALQSRPFE